MPETEVYTMERGNNYLITYHNMDNKKILAMFLEEYNGMYLFKNIHGEFAITKKKIDNHEITLELIEDWIIYRQIEKKKLSAFSIGNKKHTYKF